MSILEVKNVSKSFTGHKALDDVSLSVEPGEVYGLLGPNGAGKTTLIRIINHITAPDSGTVMFDGHPLTANDVVNIGYLPEERGLYKKMKVGEQAMFFARLKGMSAAEAEKSLRSWFERLEISDWWGRKVEELSKGMAQKVQFVVTVLHRPKLLIFDEPFSGFDPINASILKREILALRDHGATVIFSTHNMGSVEELCDRITLINRSRNILTGSVRDIKSEFSNHRYRLAYDNSSVSPATAILPLVHNLAESGQDTMGHPVLTFELNSPELRREVLSAANNASEIISFEPVLPTMDDIFVRAVRETDQSTLNSTPSTQPTV